MLKWHERQARVACLLLAVVFRKGAEFGGELNEFGSHLCIYINAMTKDSHVDRLVGENLIRGRGSRPYGTDLHGLHLTRRPKMLVPFESDWWTWIARGRRISDDWARDLSLNQWQS